MGIENRVNTLFRILILALLALNCRAAIVPIQETVFTTNTFDTDIVGGAIPYFDFPSGKFVASPTAYANALFYDPALGFLSIVHTNDTGDLLLNLAVAGAAGQSIQAYADKFVVANTNLTFDAVGPYSIRLRINGSNVLEAVAGSISLSGQTNLVADNGSALTFNGAPIGGALTDTVLNNVASAGLLAVDATKTNGIAATLAHMTNALGLTGSTTTFVRSDGNQTGPDFQLVYYGSQYGFTASNITPTNIRSGNLPLGTNDIFTVPAAKRLMLTAFNISSTNASTITHYALLKTNGNYFRFSIDGTATTGACNAIGNTGDNFLFEAGESIAISTTLNGANVSLAGLLFPTNAPMYSPRKLSLSVGNNTVYTCPAGKCALSPPIITEPSNAGDTSVSAVLMNESGTTRSVSFYVVPSGGSPGGTNIKFTKNAANKSFTSLPGEILFPGDFLVVATDASTATQWVRLTVIEIPFP